MDCTTNNITPTATSNGAGEPAATQPVTTAATPDMQAITQAVLNAVDARTQRAERSALRSMAEQYSMTEAELTDLLTKARDERANAIPPEVQQRIDEATERANNLLISAEVRNVGQQMGLIDAETALLLLDRTGVTVEEGGTVNGVQDALNALKAAKPYLFAAAPAAWGQKQGGSPAMTKADILKIADTAKRQKAIAENIHLFKKG